jgi:hypothetical protein
MYVDWSGHEQEDPEGDAMREPRSETRYDLYSQEDGSITGTAWTNDDEDRGYPTTEARWEVSYNDLAHALKRTGGTHQGIGSFVSVYLDGESIDREGKPMQA